MSLRSIIGSSLLNVGRSGGREEVSCLHSLAIVVSKHLNNQVILSAKVTGVPLSGTERVAGTVEALRSAEDTIVLKVTFAATNSVVILDIK